jgi:hypothetical protein
LDWLDLCTTTLALYPVVNSEALGLAPGTDVMIFKIISPKNSAKKIGVFDSK